MCAAAEVSGAASTSPIIPKRHPPAMVTMRTTSGWIPSVAPNAIGCTICWRPPFARITTTSMISPTVVPSEPSAMITANAPATNAPRYGTYAQRKVTSAIVAASGTPRMSAAIPTTIPLNAATIVTPRKYRRSDVHHVAGDRLRDRQRHAEVPIDRGAQRGPVLEQEEEAEQQERQAERERRDARDPLEDPMGERGDRHRGLALDRRVRAVGGARGAGRADAGVGQPALDLARRGVERRRDLPPTAS